MCIHFHTLAPAQWCPVDPPGADCPLPCQVTVALSPPPAISSRNTCQETLSLATLFGTQGASLGLYSPQACWYHTLASRHQVTQQSNPGHPTKTCLPLWKNNGHILGWQRVYGAPIEEEVRFVAGNLRLNLKAIDPVCLFSLKRDVLLEDLSGTPLYWVNGKNWAQCMETTANHSP